MSSINDDERLFTESETRIVRDRLTVQGRVNPFAYHDNLTVFELIKCCLGIIIVPIRLFFLLIVIVSSMAKVS